MKKLIFALALGFSLSGFAQESTTSTPVRKYSVATNPFWSNWFFQGGLEWNAWYSAAEHGNGLARSPFKSFRSNPGIGLAVGKWFTPELGLRTKLQGIWGKTVDPNRFPKDLSSPNKYWILSEQIMLNLNNLICGYDEDRVWNFIPFVGGGLGHSMSHGTYSMGLNVGAQSLWKLNDKLGIYVEAGWHRYENGIDGSNDFSRGKRGWDSHTNNLYAELGVNVNLGKSNWEKTPDIDAINALHQSELDALNSQLNDANAENDRLKKLLAEQKEVEQPAPVKEYVTTPVSVFFNIGKNKVANRRDLVSVEQIAKYAKDNDAKVLVEGYADSATGSAELNNRLSQERAEAVAAELEKLGVPSGNIMTKGHGGVSDLSPVSYNRRATVQISE